MYHWLKNFSLLHKEYMGWWFWHFVPCTSNDTGLYNTTEINELVQGSADNMSTTKKGKHCMKVCQADFTEQIYALWPMKYCAKADANLCSLTCKLLQGNKIKSNHKSSIVVQSFEGNIAIDHSIKTHDGWVARVEFFWDIGHKRGQLANAFTKKNINNLHAKLGNSSEVTCNHQVNGNSSHSYVQTM